MAETLTSTQSDPDRVSAGKTAPELIFALFPHDLRRTPFRIGLKGVDFVSVGRADASEIHDRKVGPLRELAIREVDGWISTAHARIVRAGGRFVLEDQGSTNGTFVNGERVDRAELRHGDTVEFGRTFAIFREVAEQPVGRPAHANFETLCAELAVGFEQLAKVAQSTAAILIRGPSGTGKELTARAVHDLSNRNGPIVAVNCGAIPEELVEGELFGHRKGAFSGANEDRIGLVRAAEGGTLFLDEIGDLPISSQAALLRVIQEGEVKPVGANAPVRVNVRFVSATHRDLSELIATGDFRADLFARLSGFEFRLPPLADRHADMGIIVKRLIERIVGTIGAWPRLSGKAARVLMLHGWPLNIRELEQCLTTAIALAEQKPIQLEHLPEALVRPQPPPPLPSGTLREAPPGARPRGTTALTPQDEQLKSELEEALRTHRGNVSAVARAMGKDRRQIHRWIDRFQLVLIDYRSND